MATMYAHPTPATQGHHFTKSRGYRKCDTCGKAEEPGMQRFRMCGGCMITQYCTPDCQKRHWPHHKAICQHTLSVQTAAKQDAAVVAGDENLVKYLRKFCSAHERLLNWTVFQALQLKRVPSNIRHNALQVEVGFRNHVDPNRRFVIQSARLIPRSHIEASDPLVAKDIERREARCRAAGGIGTAVLIVQCGGLSQVMPVECDSPSRISWDSREDWADILSRYVEAGRLDFMPVTTTSKGVIYG